ncbi:hypothetical protein PTSG_05200 [Salpingoeca rosetta]|uniref:CBS domain-containing protein n=1 Tax=Salpingoeca rosetta (strain ATCC 50818 / BSB-021) TaxID=946362 RepID=F2UAT0_SALR5|nr:uncharacterized protein PTSG_05200 [Salpingoeca rosetta]EGD73496.1 hypothetical protein PTSG_05200 [Salpingoeca rosetta]|eukprot:XP_004993778.1 hypothetical protein PTSG_05200 [Salpingoeca rosetta]
MSSEKPSAKRKAEDAETPLRRLLVSTTLADVQHGRRRVVSINHNATADDALHELAKEHILSAPVVLAASIEDQESDTYMGIIDISAILKGLFEDVLSKASEKAFRWEALKESAQPFFDRKVITLLGNDVQLRYRGETTQSLHDLIADGFLGAGEHEQAHDLAHRIAIFTPTGRINDVISMSDVVLYLSKHKKSLGEKLLQTTAEEFGWADRDVPTVSSKDIVASVVHTMVDKKHAAVAVVDDDCKFRHNFSNSDLRGLTPKKVPMLLRSVEEFIHAMERKHQHEADITCKPYATFESILDRLVKQRVHRLYVVGDDKKVKGVVSLTDILRAVVAAA